MKTCRIVKWLFAVALMLMVNYSAMAQIKPSVYAGIGNYTNLGGTVGIGTEVRYKFISVNAAIGTAFYLGTFENLEIVGSNPWFGFDFGVKGYIYKGLFAGVNYGVLGKTRYMETQDRVRVGNLYGFSFTAGYKWNFYKGIYGMAYAGWTSNKDANNFFGDFGGYLPRMGITLGYDFKH